MTGNEEGLFWASEWDCHKSTLGREDPDDGLSLFLLICLRTEIDDRCNL